MLPDAEKAVLRAERLAARDALGPELRAEKSAAIVRHGLESIAFAPGTVVSGYFPIRSEADIMPLIAAFEARGARVCLPAVLDRETIVFRLHDRRLPLAATGFGTRGPSAEAPLVDPDILLVPLAAFDRRGHRIGYGAGHYDRAIARLRQKGLDPRLIGIAFSCQEVAEVPAGPHDVGLDAVLTENGFFPLR